MDMDKRFPEDPVGASRDEQPAYPTDHEQQQAEVPRSRLAIASVALAIIPVVGVIAGLLALRRTGEGGKRGRNMAIIALSLCALWTGLIALVLVLDGSGVLDNDLDRDRAGRIVESGDLDVDKLRPGDCLQDPRADDDEIDTVDAVPCSKLHDAQVVATIKVDGDDYPGNEGIQREAAQCGFQLERARLAAQTRSDIPGVDLPLRILPSEDSWDAGDRDIACILIFTGPFRGELAVP